MPPAAMAGVAIGTAVISAYGQYKAGQAQKKAMGAAAQANSAQAVMARMRQTNPQLYQAAYGQNIFGQAPTGSFADYLDWQTQQAPKVAANPLAAMFQMPGYMNPALMNQGLQEIDESYTRNIAGGGNFAAQMGLAGGMADMYSFAASAARQRARQDVWQNFQQQTEQLKRQDIGQGQQMLQGAVGQAQGGQGAQSQYMSQAFNPTNWATQLGQVGGAAITAYGTIGNRVKSPQAGATGMGMMPQGQGPLMSYQYPARTFGGFQQVSPNTFYNPNYGGN